MFTVAKPFIGDLRGSTFASIHVVQRPLHRATKARVFAISVSAADLVGLISTVAAASGALAAFLAARATRVAAEESFREQHQAATLSYVQLNRERYRALRAEAGPLPDTVPRALDEQGQVLLNLIELWEHQAAGLNDGVFDLEVFNKMTGGYLLAIYREYSPFIRSIRRENAAYYDQLEVVIDKLIVMRAAGFVVDRGSIRLARRDGLTRAEARRLSVLVRRREYSYVDLQRRLLDIGLDTEKNRITRLTRRPLGHIEPMGESHRADAIDMFLRLQEATGGKYPPKALLEHYFPPGRESITKWLSSGDGNRHFIFITEAAGAVAGHVEVEWLPTVMSDEQRAYWAEAFLQPAFEQEHRDGARLRLTDLAIIKRLGVDPLFQRRDIGRQLLRRAIHEIEQGRRVPALVVLEDLGEAQRLYESEGARLVGRFQEATGERMRSYVF